MSTDFIDALEKIEKNNKIEKEVIIEALENSLLTACKKNYEGSKNLKVLLDRETGKPIVYVDKLVVETVEEPDLEISLDLAHKISPNYNLGDIVQVDVTPKDFGRIVAQKAKQVVVQKIRESEREMLYNEYLKKKDEVITGTVHRKARNNTLIISLGNADGILKEQEQVKTEKYTINKRIKVYVVDVEEGTKEPRINVSRTHPGLVKRLFEMEVPEIYNGFIEIKSISREPGSRTKIAVYSKNSEIDAIGACVGHGGSRVNAIVNELAGEKMDIVPWSEDPVKFISSALSPSQVISVDIREDEKSAYVIVPDHQLSLAIGKEGQNVRLAARLTGYRIDIKSESQSMKELQNEGLVDKLEDIMVDQGEEKNDVVDITEKIIEQAQKENKE